MYEKTKAFTANALKNAVRLEKFCEENGYTAHTTECMPSTDVYRFVDKHK